MDRKFEKGDRASCCGIQLVKLFWKAGNTIMKLFKYLYFPTCIIIHNKSFMNKDVYLNFND